MKKIFLSLAAMAFLAVGTVSCGSDDSSSTTTPVNPGEPGEPGEPGDPDNVNGTLTVGGQVYDLNSTIYGVVGSQANGPTGYNIDTDGDEVPDTICTLWIMGSYDGDDYSASANGADYYLYVPVSGESVVQPHESETLYLASTDVWVNGASLVTAEAQITAFDMNINAFDLDNTKISYKASVGLSTGITPTVDFSGYLDGIYYFTLNSSKGVKSKATLNQKFDNNSKVINISNEIIKLK